MVRRQSDGPQGWVPPKFLYVIHEGMSIGSTVLAAGPHPVSYMRKEPAQEHGSCTYKDGDRLDYLRALARIEPLNQQGNIPEFSAAFRWVDAAKYQSDAEALLTVVRTSVSYLRKALVDRRCAHPGRRRIRSQTRSQRHRHATESP